MENKVIVITGASHGLGKSLAEILASKKAHVVISARNGDELNEVAKAISATAIVGDVTKESDMKNLVEKTISQFGKIDIFINNAGVWLPKSFIEDTDMKRAHDVFEVNLFGVVYATRSVLPEMKKEQSGMIVNIVSTSALEGRPQQTIYSSSKFAARGFTDSLREELKDTPIKVLGVYPGGIKTHLFDEKAPAELNDFMTPESVAEKIIAYISSENPEPNITIRRPGQ
jgi:short-subunit dehydrogenase